MQRTTNYGLCQYEGSDKTSYLVNYNSDMLKIDTAIKNAADAGSGAGTAAEQAQTTADNAALGVTNLNTQINGANGLASDVAVLQGSVGSINSLIGNGHPTTSDQTLIGAINGIEGAIAPREDSDNLANSYAIGEQFARGGSVYSALTSLTAGTAFASLVLNTNYKASASLVEQIAGASEEVTAANVSYDNTASGLTADDVQEALDEIVAALPSAGAVEFQTGTLTAGQTSVVLTFAEQTIGSNTLIDVYVEDGILFSNIATTSNTITLTFAVQASDIAVAARVTN